MCPLKVGGFGVDEQNRSANQRSRSGPARKWDRSKITAAEERETRPEPLRLHRSDLMYKISASI